MVRFAPFFFFFWISALLCRFGLNQPFRRFSPIRPDLSHVGVSRGIHVAGCGPTHSQRHPSHVAASDASAMTLELRSCIPDMKLMFIWLSFSDEFHLVWWKGNDRRQQFATSITSLSFSLTHFFFFYFLFPIQDKILTLNIFGIIFVFCG